MWFSAFLHGMAVAIWDIQEVGPYNFDTVHGIIYYIPQLHHIIHNSYCYPNAVYR